MADHSVPECIDLSALIPSGSGPVLVPVNALKALLGQVLKSDQALEEAPLALIRRNLHSLLRSGILNPIQEWSFYALLSYLLHHFLDTIVFVNCKASILCFPQARFTNTNEDAVPASAVTPDVEPSPSSTTTPLTPPVPGPAQSKQTPQANEGERRIDHRDPDFAQYALIELEDGTVVKVLSSWLEAKPEPRSATNTAATDDASYRRALIKDLTQLTEQAELAFLQQPERDTFISLYTRGKRFTAFKWSKTKTSIFDIQSSDSTAPAPTTEPADAASSPLGDMLCDSGQDEDEDSSASDGDDDTNTTSFEDEPRDSGSSSTPVQPFQSTASAQDPAPITDTRSFPGTSCWEDDLRTKLLCCAETARRKYYKTMDRAHGRSLPIESRKSLRKRYDKVVTAEALVDMHPQPLYYDTNILTGSGEDLSASHQFTNALRLAHSGTNPNMRYEQSDFFPVLHDENHYRPSEREFLEIEQVMADMYEATIDREWGRFFEDERHSHETEDGNRSGNKSYEDTGSLEEEDSGDFGEAPFLPDDMPTALQIPGSQTAVEFSSSLSTNNHVRFANDDAPSASTPRMTRSQKRAAQVDTTSSEVGEEPAMTATAPNISAAREYSSGGRGRGTKKSGPTKAASSGRLVAGTRSSTASKATKTATRTTGTNAPRTTISNPRPTRTTRGASSVANSLVAAPGAALTAKPVIATPGLNVNASMTGAGAGGPTIAGPSRPRRAHYTTDTQASLAKARKQQTEGSAPIASTVKKGLKRTADTMEPDEPPDSPEPPKRAKRRRTAKG